MVHGQNLIESVVVPLQSLAQHGQPLIHRVDACLGETARALRAIDAADDEPGIFEHSEMLGDFTGGRKSGVPARSEDSSPDVGKAVSDTAFVENYVPGLHCFRAPACARRALD